jgi:hypothetical protein
MSRILVIDIDGDVDQSSLERLQTHLNLTRRGRLTDDYDQEFGYRIIESASGQETNIGLFRNFDESWKISVMSTSQPDLGSDELALLRAELVEGITAAGFQATVRGKPTFGTRA